MYDRLSYMYSTVGGGSKWMARFAGFLSMFLFFFPFTEHGRTVCTSAYGQLPAFQLVEAVKSPWILEEASQDAELSRVEKGRGPGMRKTGRKQETRRTRRRSEDSETNSKRTNKREEASAYQTSTDPTLQESSY